MALHIVDRYVRQFCLRLLPRLYEVVNSMPYDGASDMEVGLAIALREEGYGCLASLGVAGAGAGRGKHTERRSHFLTKRN